MILKSNYEIREHVYHMAYIRAHMHIHPLVVRKRRHRTELEEEQKVLKEQKITVKALEAEALQVVESLRHFLNKKSLERVGRMEEVAECKPDCRVVGTEACKRVVEAAENKCIMRVIPNQRKYCQLIQDTYDFGILKEGREPRFKNYD